MILSEIVDRYTNNFSGRNDQNHDNAGAAITEGYLYWIESGSGATLKTTVYVDRDAGMHSPPQPFQTGPADFAIATLDGVSANQLNASHFFV